MDFLNQMLVRLQNESQLITNFVLVLLVLNFVLSVLVVNKKLKLSRLIKVTLSFTVLAFIFQLPLGRVYWLNGWGWHDWFLFINLALIFLLTCLIIIKRKKSFALINFFYTLIVLPIIMLAFFGVGRSVSIGEGYYGGYWLLDQPSQIALQQISKSVVVSKSRGMTGSSNSYIVVAVNSRDGRFIWSFPLDRGEYLKGKLNNEALIVNGEGRDIYFVDIKTGKVTRTEEELINTYPLLKDRVSYRTADYVLSSPTVWYMHGADDKYYRIDERSKEVTVSAQYRKEFSTDDSVKDQKIATAQRIGEQLQKKFPQMLSPQLLDSTDAQQPIIIFKQRLDDVGNYVAKLDLAHSATVWQIDMTEDKDESEGSFRVYGKNNDQQLIFSYKSHLYAIDDKTGKVSYRYNFKWNQIERDSLLPWF